MALIIVVVTFCLYFPNLFNYFYADSYILVKSNFQDLFLPFFGGRYYRPVVILTGLIDQIIWDHNPVGFHLTNIFLHLMNGYLITLLYCLINSKSRLPLIGILLFLIHPATAESANWIAGRTDILSTMMMLGALIFFIRARSCPSLFVYCGFTILTVLALLSKENSLILPLVVIMLDLLLPLSAEYKSSRFKIYSCVFLGNIIGLVIRINVLGTSNWLLFPSQELLISGKWLLSVFYQYFKWTIFLEINPYYNPNFSVESNGILPIFVFAGMLITCFMIKEARIGFFWFAIALLPVYNLKPVLRYLYFPLIGVIIMIGLALAKICERFKYPLIVEACLIPFILIAIVQTNQNLTYWRKIAWDESMLAKKIKEAVPALEPDTQIFVFGINYPGEDPPLRANNEALRTMFGLNSLKWLSDLDDINLQRPVKLFLWEPFRQLSVLPALSIEALDRLVTKPFILRENQVLLDNKFTLSRDTPWEIRGLSVNPLEMSCLTIKIEITRSECQWKGYIYWLYENENSSYPPFRRLPLIFPKQIGRHSLEIKMRLPWAAFCNKPISAIKIHNEPDSCQITLTGVSLSAHCSVEDTHKKAFQDTKLLRPWK